MKKIQSVAMWLLPIIVIGGLFFPLIGYLVVGMMAFFLPFSFFKGRYWCWHLCPRGAFLDVVMSKASPEKPVPRLFTKRIFRFSVLALLMGFVVYRIIKTGGDPVLIGAVFVFMCLITTMISIIMALAMRHRSWCAICPMGTLQESIHSLSGRKKA